MSTDYQLLNAHARQHWHFDLPGRENGVCTRVKLVQEAPAQKLRSEHINVFHHEILPEPDLQQIRSDAMS